MKLQKLDVLLLNLVVVFEAHRIKGMTLFWAAEAAKQQVTGLAEAVWAAWFWPDHFFTQAKKKKFLVGFNQCGFTAWQRKSSKYSNNVATVTPVSLQPASDNRSSVVSSTGLGVLHCGASMRLRLGRGFAHPHNTCSVTTCSCKHGIEFTTKSTRYTKYCN